MQLEIDSMNGNAICMAAEIIESNRKDHNKVDKHNEEDCDSENCSHSFKIIDLI